jgi:hypothetical protein
MNRMNNAVKDFLVNVLGCKCPDEVFFDVELNTSPAPVGTIPLDFEIHVGGRIIMLGVAAEYVLSAPTALSALVAAGTKIRNEREYNRFRLVVLADDSACEAKLRPRFTQLPGADDRIHIHVVNKVDTNFQTFYRAIKEGSGEISEIITEPTRWHEMKGPVIGGREHYQEKSYGGFTHKWEPFTAAEDACRGETLGDESER